MFFNTRKKTNPRNPSESKYYPCPRYTGKVDLHQIAEQISYASSFTEADVYGVLSIFAAMIPRYLELGEIVEIEGLGTFRISFSGKGSEKREDVQAKDVDGIKMLFTPIIALMRRWGIVRPFALKTSCRLR